MKRWKMCPRCGIKMGIIEKGPELTIHMCPISKDWYMTFSGELLKKLEKISVLTDKSISDLIHDACKRSINVIEKEDEE